MASTLVTIAARLEADLVSRIDRQIDAGRVTTRTQAVVEALAAWVAAAEDDRWAHVLDESPDEGLGPAWDDDETDWAALYAAR